MSAKNGTILSHAHDACHLAFDFRPASKLAAANALPQPQATPVSSIISPSTCRYPLCQQNRSCWIRCERTSAQGIVDNRPWKTYTKMFPKIKEILILFDGIESGRQIKAFSGKRDPKRQVWQLPYEKETGPGISDGIVGHEPFEKVSTYRNI